MPTIADPARLARQMEAEAHRIDCAKPESYANADPTDPAPNVAGCRQREALDHAWRVHAAIEALAETIPTTTLAEAAVLLTQAGDIVEALKGAINPLGGTPHPDERAMREWLDRLGLILVNVAPLLASFGDVSPKEVRVDHLAGRRAWLFGPVP
jgi:hypothetical protein